MGLSVDDASSGALPLPSWRDQIAAAEVAAVGSFLMTMNDQALWAILNELLEVDQGASCGGRRLRIVGHWRLFSPESQQLDLGCCRCALGLPGALRSGMPEVMCMERFFCRVPGDSCHLLFAVICGPGIETSFYALLTSNNVSMESHASAKGIRLWADRQDPVTTRPPSIGIPSAKILTNSLVHTAITAVRFGLPVLQAYACAPGCMVSVVVCRMCPAHPNRYGHLVHVQVLLELELVNSCSWVPQPAGMSFARSILSAFFLVGNAMCRWYADGTQQTRCMFMSTHVYTCASQPDPL